MKHFLSFRVSFPLTLRQDILLILALGSLTIPISAEHWRKLRKWLTLYHLICVMKRRTYIHRVASIFPFDGVMVLGWFQNGYDSVSEKWHQELRTVWPKAPENRYIYAWSRELIEEANPTPDAVLSLQAAPEQVWKPLPGWLTNIRCFNQYTRCTISIGMTGEELKASYLSESFELSLQKYPKDLTWTSIGQLWALWPNLSLTNRQRQVRPKILYIF